VYNSRQAIAHLYDPAAETDRALTLAEFLASRFDARPAIGDRTRFGAVELIVRDMQGDAITEVGVELDPTPRQQWRRSWFRRLHWRCDDALRRTDHEPTVVDIRSQRKKTVYFAWKTYHSRGEQSR
jgi:NhaP-type Na+/H+ and K+/H+ antiporter